jgi:hypothetical protein
MVVTREQIKIGVAIAILVLLIILLVTMFRSTSKDQQSPYKELLEAKDETIRAKDETIAAREDMNHRLDETITTLFQRDSMLRAEYIQHQPIYSKIDAKLKEIPARIARIAGNDDSIRAAFSR